MVSLDDMKDLLLYRRPFFLPIDPTDKKKGSAIMLMTPNYKSSMLAMTAPYVVNKRYFESYYVEKAITRFIHNESVYDMDNSDEYIFEEALTSKERNDLQDSDFGLPSQRRYPMPDKSHVLSAIRFFNHVEEKYEKELAKNIIKKISEFNMANEVHVGESNRFKKYWEKSSLYKNESTIIENDETLITEADEQYFHEYIVSDNILRITSDRLNTSNIYFSGYAKDIKEVKKHFDKNSGIDPFKKLELDSPKRINVIVTNSPDTDEEFTNDSLVIYTKDALSGKDYKFDYDKYIKFIMQLFAIYTLPKAMHYDILPTLSEPAAIYLSGIADSDIAKPRNKIDGLNPERTMKYIVDTYGIHELKNILITNNLSLFMKYGKEYYTEIKESELDIDDDSYNLLKEEGEIETPESIKKIQNMAANLKRRIRRQSVYKLNKIKRDLLRGNLGTEERGEGLSGLQQLQTGNITGNTKEEESPEGTTEQFDFWSKGDYITEGNVMYLFEDNINYDIALRKALYNDRFRNVKQVMNVYKDVKLSLPFIKYTYADINRYNRKNLFYDMSYYNESFFRNFDGLNDEDKTNNLRRFKIFAELMNRLISSGDLSGYNKKTIFIPILDWRHNNSLKMWMYKEDVNPISVIYYYMKYDAQSLKKLFKNYDVIFMGAKNYFKVNFGNTDLSKPANITKFMTLIKRIVALGYNSPADPDPEGEFEDSPTGIAMDIVDKIEKSQNVSIDNVSNFNGLKKEVDMFDNPIRRAEETDAIKNKVTAQYKASDKEYTTKTGTMTGKVRDNSLRGRSVTVPVNVTTKDVSNADIVAATGVASSNKSVNTTSEEDKKDAITRNIAKVVDSSKNTDDALDKLDDDEFKKMILDLQTDSEENVRVDKARASKITQIEDEFHSKEVAGKSVKEMLNSDPTKNELPKTDLHIASINKDWSNLTFMNFDKNYDPDADMIKMLDSMQNWTFPVAVKDIDVTDNSTSEDVLNLWKIECVDYKGTKFTLKVDIPRFINGSNFLKLRGNEKNIFIQSILIPIIKSGLDECQIIGSGGYNKIFVRRYGARRGQSMPSTSKLLKTLNRLMVNKSTEVKVVYGDNTKVCAKYELPMDYIDIAMAMDTIESNQYKFYFNQDALRTDYQIDDTKGFPIGVKKVFDAQNKSAKEEIVYYNSNIKSAFSTVTAYITELLSEDSVQFREIQNNIMVAGMRYTYSQASILNVKIPVIIVCSYLEGLITTLKKARVGFEFVKDLDKNIRYSDRYDYVKFNDGYLVYEVNYSSSLLLNGFKDCDTESYSIKEVNSKKMYMEFLESYGGMIKSDGLENSYDCMIDPITKEILEMYKLPTDYVSVMLHANNLLSDNKYVRHTDQSGRRWRRKELIAGYFYKALTASYEEYANSIRHNRKNTKMTIKQSAVIDLLLSKDPSTSDLSVNNVINDVECANTVSNKGLVGMNQARAYSVGTRVYDESMLNVLGMDTAFSGAVGINRQATVDANIQSERGLVKTIDGDSNQLSIAKTMTITEAMTPLGSTHDDPQRTLMTYMQTSKHMVRTLNADPTLITNGADEALPYLASDLFSTKAKQDGVVVEIVEEGFGKHNYMVVQYNDGTNEFINLSEEIKKNSDGGYFVPMKLQTDLKVGQTFKANEVLAYDHLSFSKSLGESGNLAANLGKLAKIAIINTDEAFEDSAVVTESFAEKLGTEVIMNIDTVMDKAANIFIYKNIGDHVMEGDTLFAYQAAFDDEVANALLKNLSMNQEEISELGRNPVKTKYTGIVENIEIYRTVELEDMSESLRNFVVKYESKIKKTKSIYNKYNMDTALLPTIGKSQQTGKVKNVDNGVKIIYYIKFVDRLGVGDKIVFYSANKGIVKYMIPRDKEPYTEFRPNEHVDSFMSLSSISGRMTPSIALMAACTKLMVELDRSVKDLLGIFYDDSIL